MIMDSLYLFLRLHVFITGVYESLIILRQSPVCFVLNVILAMILLSQYSGNSLKD